MKTLMRKIAIAALATTTIAGVTLPRAYAAQNNTVQTAKTDQVAQASQTGEANPDLRLSQDGFNVMREIRAARVAIFNGDANAAKTFVANAAKTLDKVKTDATLANKGIDRDHNLVPIDGQLVVSDNFVATPEKAQHIASGNDKIKQGKGKEAVEELKLANVDIGFTRVLMPYQETFDHLTVATNLMNHENFYEANMALKAAEEGLQVETVMLVETPKTDTNTTGSIAPDHGEPSTTANQPAASTPAK